MYYDEFDDRDYRNGTPGFRFREEEAREEAKKKVADLESRRVKATDEKASAGEEVKSKLKVNPLMIIGGAFVVLFIAMMIKKSK